MCSDGMRASSNASERSSQLKRHSEGPEEASFALSRPTEGSELRQIQTLHPCKTASSSSKGQNPRFSSFSPIFHSFYWLQQEKEKKTKQDHSVTIICIMHITDVLFLQDASFVKKWSQSKISPFIFRFLSFFIMISVLMNPTREPCNSTSFLLNETFSMKKL